MPSKFKPTRDRKQRRKPKVYDRDAPAAAEPAIAVASQDPNADIIIPLSKAEKEARRRAELKDEAKAVMGGEKKMSGKKLKRFNKYIETKLKKEEKQELIAKLSETQVDTSLFRSTKMLGAPKETKREMLRRALAEERAGINIEENKEILYEERHIADPEDMVVDAKEGAEEEEEEEQPEKMETAEEKQDKRESYVAGQMLQFKSVVGAGLKRPLESDENGRPIIKRIKKARQSREEKLKAIMDLMDDASTSADSDSDLSSDSNTDSNSDVESEANGLKDDEEEFKGFSDSEKEESSRESNPHSSSSSSEAEENSEDGAEESGEEDDSNDEDDEESSGSERAFVPRLKRGQSDRANAFKEWALAQRKQVLGEESTPSNVIADLLELQPKIVHVPRKREEDMTPPPELQVPTIERKAYYVTVNRPEHIQTSRLQLPIVAEEQKIMEAIHAHSCVVICGETGSGKTTQIPQFLYEAGYGTPGSPTPGLIAVTQPRRVAAVSMAKRVGEELGEGGEKKVAYQIRFEGTVGSQTVIKFMTDGVLLRELGEDLSLKKYSVVVVDEAHERGVNTDVLIGVLSRVVKLREEMAKEDDTMKPLKLIIMSATLRVEDFTENKTLFRIPPPLVKADARQYPVSIHFSRRTSSDYIEETFKKVCKIHRRLPAGGILVFLTGQNEINTLLRRLRTTFPFPKKGKLHPEPEAPGPEVRISAADAPVETEDVDFGDVAPPEIDSEDDGDSILDEDDDLGHPEEMSSMDVEFPLHVLPLYSLLPTKEQLKVFDAPPEGSRLCVLATNVAETSLTIPGIRYVVDCGRSKERKYDKTTGVQSFEVGWVSKASASQRAGRSGRTGPGHCYRLYSSAVFERDFEEFAEAEILRMPIDGVVLGMKAMGIDNVVGFPFPTAPERGSLFKAEKLLGFLGALDSKGALTDLGKNMNIFPLSPRFAKVLIIGQQHGCLPYVIAIVAALSVGAVFIPENQLDIQPDDTSTVPDNATKIEQTLRANRRRDYFRAHKAFSQLDPTSDALKLLSVVCAFAYVSSRQSEWCESKFVRLKAMTEINKLRQQLTKIVETNNKHFISGFEPKLPKPTDIQVKALKQILAAGFIDQIALRADLVPNSPYKLSGGSKNPIDVPYITLFPSSDAAYEEPVVYIHPSSILATSSTLPEYIVYSDLRRAASGKVRMNPLTTVTGPQLAALAKGCQLITYSKPLDSGGVKELEGGKREVWVIPRIGAQVGRSDMGWELPARKVVQRREGGRWVVE
ncbi:putative ATP-dependent RNA helicase DHR1 [Rhizina undulata]